MLFNWRILLRVPWTARTSNQSILKEISPEYSLERLMLKLQYLATWCKELNHWKISWCWKRLKAGGEGDDRGWDGWMASLTRWTWVWASSRSWWYTGKPGVLQSMGSQSRTWLSNWTDWLTEGMEATYTSIKYSLRWLDKEDMVQICNGILLSHKKDEIVPCAATW